jgi:hypothetical protein
MLITNSAPLPIAVQSSFAQNPALSGYLCHNQELTAETWNTLWDKNQPLDEASALVRRPLSDDQFIKVLRTEKRVQVIERMFDVNPPTLAHLPLLENLKLTSGISGRLEELFGNDTTAMAALGPRLAPAHKLRWIVNSSPDTISDDEFFTYIVTIDKWWGKTKDYHRRGMGLKAALVARPQLVSKLAQHGCHLNTLTSLAGSTDLVSVEDQRKVLGDILASQGDRQYALLAFLHNPKVHQEVLDEVVLARVAGTIGEVEGRRSKNRGTITEPLSEVKDLGDLVWLVGRAIPFHGIEKNQPGKLGELLALSTNKEITLEMADSLARGLVEMECEDLLLYRIRSAQQTLAARFPKVGMQYGFIDDPDETPTVKEEYVATRADYYDYKERLPHETNAFAAIEYGETNHAQVLTEILGEDPGVWISFLAILKDHAKESTLADLAKTARRINA